MLSQYVHEAKVHYKTEDRKDELCNYEDAKNEIQSITTTDPCHWTNYISFSIDCAA